MKINNTIFESPTLKFTEAVKKRILSGKDIILIAIDGVSRKSVEDSKSGAYVDPENKYEYYRIIENIYLKRVRKFRVRKWI